MGLHSSQNPNLFTKISTSNRDEPQFCDIMSLAAHQKERNPTHSEIAYIQCPYRQLLATAKLISTICYV